MASNPSGSYAAGAPVVAVESASITLDGPPAHCVFTTETQTDLLLDDVVDLKVGGFGEESRPCGRGRRTARQLPVRSRRHLPERALPVLGAPGRLIERPRHADRRPLVRHGDSDTTPTCCGSGECACRSGCRRGMRRSGERIGPGLRIRVRPAIGAASRRDRGDRCRAAQPEARVGPSDEPEERWFNEIGSALLIVLTLTFLFSALMIVQPPWWASRRPSPADTGMGSRLCISPTPGWPWFWPNFAGCRIGPLSFEAPFHRAHRRGCSRVPRPWQVARCFYVAGRDPCSSAWRASRHRAPSRPAGLWRGILISGPPGMRWSASPGGPILPDRTPSR